jgi:hypothetical protein
MVRVEISSTGGERRESLCCGVGLDILDNWEVFAALPEELREAALATDRAQAEEQMARWRAEDAACERRQAEWRRRNVHLYEATAQEAVA